MEKLSHAINHVVDNGTWKLVRMVNNDPPLSHLFFAGDILIFTKALASQAKILAAALSQFSNESGLIINLAKSRAFYSSGVPRQKVEKITTITSIRSALSLEKYVGFPMLKGRVKHSDYAYILDKLNNRLPFWKNKMINKVGRITLTKSVLNSIPIYYMQIS